MTDDNQRKLQQAYDLIRQERFEEAQLVLQPIIFDAPSADAWWLWANAVTEPEDARYALARVLEFDPGHSQAQQLISRLEHVYPAVPEAQPYSPAAGADDNFDDIAGEVVEPASIEADIPDILPPDTATTEDLEAISEDYEPTIRQLEHMPDDTEPGTALDFSDWLEDLAEAEQTGAPEIATAADAGFDEPVVAPQKGRSALRGLLVVLLIVVIGLGLAVVLWQLNDGSQPLASDQREWVSVSEPSEQLQAVMQAAQQGLSPDELGGPPEVRLVEYEDGTALLITVCRGAGADIPAALQAGMQQAARYGISAQDELSHIGVSLANCERADVLAEAVASIDDAAAFASGRLNMQGYQAAWQLNP